MKTRLNRVKSNRPRGKRPTIGLLDDPLYNEYNISIWRGARDMAWARGANLICFPGGVLTLPDQICRPDVVLYDLASAETLDGLVIWGGTLAHYTGPEEIIKLCESYRTLPVVNIGLALEGITSLLVDNYQGMHDVIAHLIEVHACRHIAFVCGPKDSIEIQERYRAYVDVLTEHSIPLDPAMVVSWHEMADLHRRYPKMVSRLLRSYTAEGEAAVRILLDERKLRPGIDFDAIVGHSDAPTLDMLDLLSARGIRVPGDIAVASFDDIKESRYATPPLTAARQSFYALGAQATDMLLDLLAGETLPECVTLPMEIVVRQSCGCSNLAMEQAVVDLVGNRSGHPASWQKLETILAAQRKEIILKIVEAGGEDAGELDSGWAGRLLDTFLTVLRGKATDVFLQALDDVLHQVKTVDCDASTWQGAVSAMRQQILPCLEGDMLLRAENIWQQARVFIGETAQRLCAYQARQAEWQARTLRELEAALITTFDMGEMMGLLSEGLSRLDIPSAYLSLYENPERPAEWSRLMLAYDEAVPSDSERIELEAGGLRFPSRQLVPEGMLPDRQYSFVAEPLYFQEHQLGFALFEVGPREGSVYVALRAQISGALRAMLVFQERKRVEEELVRSNRELEQFAYVASHDLQEPLRMVKSYLQLIERRQKGKLDSDTDDFITFAVDGADRMQKLINDLLIYSRVTTRGVPFEPTDCSVILEHVLADLKVAIEESNAVVTHDDLPTVIVDGTQLAQLFQNLIGNAIKFHKTETRPEIQLKAEHSGGQWMFSVGDNGIGIAPEHFERIFLIFQRLHSRGEYEGTGIGLAVCKKIVERHGGHIWVESKPGKGSVFHFTVPDTRRR